MLLRAVGRNHERAEKGALSGAQDKGPCELQNPLHQELSALGLFTFAQLVQILSHFLSHHSMGVKQDELLYPHYTEG